VLTLLLAAGFAGAAARMRRGERIRRRLVGDVGLLQGALLPQVPPQVGAALASAAYRPAEGPGAGGDFYDVFALGDTRTAVILGDVAGHGREALPLTTSVRYTLRAYLESGLAPAATLALAGQVLGGQLKGHLVTALVAVYDSGEGTLTYACAGHPAPLLVGARGDEWRRPFTSPPLGAGVPTGRHATTISLPAGAAACFYTDGLCDVRVNGGRLGPDALREEVAALGPDLTAPALLARITERSADQPDDMAAVVLRAPDGLARTGASRIDELDVDLRELDGPRPARFLRTCNVGADLAQQVLAYAGGMAGEHGSARLVVRRQRGGPEVTVHPPRSARFTRTA
jgi:hypothetical protein